MAKNKTRAARKVAAKGRTAPRRSTASSKAVAKKVDFRVTRVRKPTAKERAAELKRRIADVNQKLKRNLPRERDVSATEIKHIVSSIVNGNPREMIVLAVDIRKSTFLMKEAINFSHFARILNDLLGTCRKSVENRNGWFDKFTGDGFLAYWSYDGVSLNGVIKNVLRTTQEILMAFNNVTIPDFRSHSRNLPDGIGLSIGLDAGTTHLVEIAEDITIVGPAVVGAVRMVSAAKGPNDVIANVYLGEYLERVHISTFRGHISSVERTFRGTKEYDLQEVYLLSLKALDAPAIDSNRTQ